MSTNFAKEFKLYESMFSGRKTKLTEDTANNKCFYMVLLRTSESYSIEALASDEATARKAYNDTLARIKPVIEEEDALILAEVFNLAAFKKLKPFAGKGFTEDEHIDNLLDNILDSYSNVLEYYEPGGDEDEQAGNNANINEYRVVLADYDTDDFDINVEFGLQDPDENEVVDYEYLLKPGQTRGDLVVYLGRDCGFTSIYVHDERPASPSDIKRLAQDTFPVTGTGDDWEDYGHID
jgi:hypothetical protein